MAEYAERLRQALSAFDTRSRSEALHDAQNLVFVLHDAEATGYVVTDEEDMLWRKLSERILDEEFGP
jgi:hypothetical protein